MACIKRSADTECESIPPKKIEKKDEPSIRSYNFIDSTDQLTTLLSDLLQSRKFAMDCESVRLGREQPLSLLNIALEDGKIYLIDVQTIGEVPNGLKEILENKQIHKIMFDCRSDADCLFHKHDIALQGMMDMQLCAYAIEHDDLSPAHKLPSFLETVQKEVSKLEREELKKLKPIQGTLERWGKRPFDDSMTKYAALEISHYLNIWTKLSARMPFTSVDEVLKTSAAYADSRVKDVSYDVKNPYKSHRYMPLNVLKPADAGYVACVECGIKLTPGSFSKIQMRKKIQKCVVCKAVKHEIDVDRNRQNNIDREIEAEDWSYDCEQEEDVYGNPLEHSWQDYT